MSLFYGVYKLVTGDNFIGNSLGNLANKYTGNAMTDADKEAANMQYQLNEQAAENANQRKIDFFNNYESIPAQAEQYKQAGFNPMLLATGGAISSASSAPQGSGTSASATQSNISDLISAITNMGYLQVQKQNAETNFYNAQTNRIAVENEAPVQVSEVGQNEARADLYRAQTNAQDILNKYLDDKYKLDIDKAHAEIRLNDAMTNTEISKQLLNDSQLKLNLSQVELNEWNSLLKSIDAYYSGAIYESQLRLNDAISDYNDANTAESQQRLKEAFATYDSKIESAIAEYNANAKYADKSAKVRISKDRASAFASYGAGVMCIGKGIADVASVVNPLVGSINKGIDKAFDSLNIPDKIQCGIDYNLR